MDIGPRIDADEHAIGYDHHHIVDTGGCQDEGWNTLVGTSFLMHEADHHRYDDSRGDCCQYAPEDCRFHLGKTQQERTEDRYGDSFEKCRKECQKNRLQPHFVQALLR